MDEEEIFILDCNECGRKFGVDKQANDSSQRVWCPYCRERW